MIRRDERLVVHFGDGLSRHGPQDRGSRILAELRVDGSTWTRFWPWSIER
jgi:hypothetical protein